MIWASDRTRAHQRLPRLYNRLHKQTLMILLAALLEKLELLHFRACGSCCPAATFVVHLLLPFLVTFDDLLKPITEIVLHLGLRLSIK